jgi:predicted HD superfamily hydrolase involved in NAD metabolism
MRNIRQVERRLRAALDDVPAGLATHVLRVVDEARRLAALHGVDRASVTVAALGHDLLRARAPAALLELARDQDYSLDDSERLEPVLLHGPLAVAILLDEYAIADPEILAAAAHHTTAHAAMTPLQKVLFIADKIEPQKLSRGAPRDRIRELAATDLDAAMRVYLDYHIAYALAHRWPLHPHTIAARNELLASDLP